MGNRDALLASTAGRDLVDLESLDAQVLGGLGSQAGDARGVADVHGDPVGPDLQRGGRPSVLGLGTWLRLGTGKGTIFRDRLPQAICGGRPLHEGLGLRGVGLVGHRHEPDLRGLQAGDALGHIAQRIQVAQLRVGGQRLRRRVEETEELVRAKEQAAARGLLDHGRQECLLTVDPAEVRTVSDIAQPNEGQGILSGDPGATGRQVQLALGVVDGFGQTDLDRSERVDHRLESYEVEHHEVVDEDAGIALDRAHDARRAPEGEVGVPLPERAVRDLVVGVLAVARCTGHRVARDADNNRGAAVAGEMHDEGCVRALARRSPELGCAQVTGVRTHHQDVERLEVGGPVGSGGVLRTLAQQARYIQWGDVGVELEVDHGSQDHHQCRAGRHHDRAAP